MSRSAARLIPLLLFAAFVTLYGAMAAPELDWGDAGESQLAAWTAGLSHPTGYPLFLMAGWLWSHLLTLLSIPPTRAVTLFSVVCGAAAVAATVPATLALCRRVRAGTGEGATSPRPAPRWELVAAVIVAILLGLSPTFWSQALLAEVYTFHILLLVLFLWVLWSIPTDDRAGPGSPAPAGAEASDGRSTLHLNAAAFAFGLFLSHHRTAILWLPGLLIWLWVNVPGVFRPRRFFRLLLWLLLPQLAYLYIPLRGPATPYLHQRLAAGQTLNLYDGSLQAFIDHSLGTVFATDVGLREPLPARLGRVWDFLTQNLSWFGIAPLLLLPLGWRRAGARISAEVLLLASGALLTILFGVFYAIGDVEVMFIPAWLALLWLGLIGFTRLYRLAPRVTSAAGLIVALLVLAARMPQSPEPRVDHTAPRELVSDVLKAAPPANAILLTNDRNEIVPIWYAQFAEGQREDLLVLSPLITLAPEHAHVVSLVEWARRFNRPVYLMKPMPGLSLRFDLEPAPLPLVRVLGPATLPSTPPLERELAPDLAVTGWSPPATLEPGGSYSVPVALTPRSPLKVPLTFSLQLFDAAGNRIAQQDAPPDPYYPPTEWAGGETVRQTFTVMLPARLPDGALRWRLSAYVLQADGTVAPHGTQILLGESRP